MGLLTWLASLGPTPAEIRTELWNLSVRHNGEPLEGARQELSRPGLRPARTVLLKACILTLREQGGATMAPARPPGG